MPRGFFCTTRWRYHRRNASGRGAGPDVGPPQAPPALPPLKNAPTMREVIGKIAKMGGFLGRKGDGEPGTEVLWKGWQELVRIAEVWEILEKMTWRIPHPRCPRDADMG